MGSAWFWISGAAFVCGIVSLVVSLGIMASIMRVVLPLLDETKDQIQDLGDLAANTVGRASETMDIVELRVSQAMGQATQGGAVVTRQAMGVGTALAGLYVASRLATLARGMFGGRSRKPRRRRK